VCTASIQGFGNVGQNAAIWFQRMLGGTIAAVSCWDPADACAYTYSHPEGVEPLSLQAITDGFGTIDRARAVANGYAVEPGDAWLSKDVDVIIPAAVEAVITGRTVHHLSDQVKVLAEAANGPTTPDADLILAERDIFVIPDVLCNAGGVICSYFEGVQNEANYYWTLQEVHRRLTEKMSQAFDSVLELAHRRGVYMREAAYMIAIERVAQAMAARGWI
jgi:glutamate dehydrogenase (NAD(P)+)